MQDQNFEKQVQQKMEELSFVPSEPTWDKVEEIIRKKKDRRRIIFWLFPIILLTGGIYLFTLSTAKDQTKIGITRSAEVGLKSTDGSSIAIDMGKDKKANNSLIRSTDNTSENFQQTKKLMLPSRVGGEGFKNSTNKTGTQKSNITKNSILENERFSIPVQMEKPTEADPKLETAETIATEKTLNTTTPSQEIQTERQNADTVLKVDAVKDSSVAKDTSKMVASENAMPKQKAKKRWQLGVHSSFGLSGINTKPLFFLSGANKSSAQVASDFYSPLLASNMSARSTRPVVVDNTPSDIRKNIAFSIGVDVHKKLSQRTSFGTGLSYNKLSTITSVGRRLSGPSSINVANSSLQVNQFYLNNRLVAEDYVTRYHIIEVPLSVSWQMFKSNPLQLNSGISVGRLLSTNALYYDAQADIYYENKSLYRKTQFSILAGFDYPILKLGKSSMSLGPKAQFQLSNLLKENAGKQHLFFGGLTTSFSF